MNSPQINMLALSAQSKEDFEIIAALTQDSVLTKKNIRWIKNRHRFSMLVNRFRWELISGKQQKFLPFKRVQAMLVFDGVLKVLARGMENTLENNVLSLLSIQLKKVEKYNEIELIFSGTTSIKLLVEFTHLMLTDLESEVVKGKTTVPDHRV